MKRSDAGTMTLLFCVGLVGGILLLRLPIMSGWETDLFSIQSLKKYEMLKTDTGWMIRGLLQNRILPLLILFFSCYCAAGFWLIAGTFLLSGLFLGFLTGLSVAEMGYSGVVFVACLLFPHWVCYGFTCSGLGKFMSEQRKWREFCIAGTAAGMGNRRKTVQEFLYLIVVSTGGILTETYVNPVLLKLFLQFYFTYLRQY